MYLVLSKMITYKKGQITRETNKFPGLLTKYRTEKQSGSGLAYTAAQTAWRCLNQAWQFAEDLREQTDTHSQLLLAMPDVDSESDTNTKIAQGDDEVTKCTKVVNDLENAEKEE